MKKLKKIAASLRKDRPESPSPGSGNEPHSGETSEGAFPTGVKVWYEPPSGEHLLDIVFVHGLTGDRERTWTYPQTEPWPQTVLPSRFAFARILTYGYDAYVVLRSGPVSHNRLSDHSRDFLNTVVAHRQKPGQSQTPLMFVVHSMGGLICKDALIMSRRSPDKNLQGVFASTLGVCFMGTPHSGSWLAKWAKIPASALGMVKSTNRHLLDVLETDNEVISRIQHEFLELMRTTAREGRDIEITCFYETLPMPVVGQIVSKESAVLSGFNNISIRADHRHMVRFREMEEEDAGRDQFLGLLTRWTETLTISGTSSKPTDEEVNSLRKQCLKSLDFPEMNARKHNVEIALKDTCQWIYEDPKYQAWASLILPPEQVKHSHQSPSSTTVDQRTSSLLWIKGKPGAGKSTLMKSILSRYQDAALDPRLSVLSFFFNARGAQLEKSISGLYRTLLFQLLRDSPFLLRLIVSKLQEKEDRQNFGWNDSELAETFHFLIRNDEKTSRLILVDALDECAEHEVRRVVDDFERTIQAASGRNGKLLVCLSSRHYPTISAKNATELHLEGRNTHDIHVYIQRELFIHEKHASAEIENKLVKKASGVFLWVVLVIRQLRIASDRGDSLEEIQDLIDRLPRELDNLFARIVATIDPQQMRSGLNIVHWVLGAMEPLSTRELYEALKLGDDQPPESLVELSRHSPPGFDGDRFERHLIESTCGLCEVGKVLPYRVQYIHESVRNFIEGPVGLEAYGFKSKQELVRARKDTIIRSFQNYSQLKEIREAFKHAESLPYATVGQLIDFIYGKRSRHFVPDAGLFAIYIGRYFFKHVRNFWYRDSIHNGPMCDRDIITVRRMLESWVFAYCLCVEDGMLLIYEQEIFEDFKDLLKEICCSSTTFMSEGDDLCRSLYKHQLLCFDFTSRNIYKDCSEPKMTYHLIFWGLANDASASIVKAAETIESRRTNQAESEQGLVSPQEACELCMEHTKDFRFVATLCTDAPNPGAMVGLASWSIDESPHALRLLLGFECAAGGGKAQPTAGDIDTGPDPFDFPHVFLLLRQQELADTSASHKSSLEVVGIYEHHPQYVGSLYRYRSWYPRTTSQAARPDSESEDEDTSDAESR